MDGNRRLKYGAVKNKGVELAIFTARIDSGRQFGKELVVQFSPGEALIQFLGIDTRGDRAKTVANEPLCQFVGINVPQRKDGSRFDTRQFLLAIGTQVA